MWRCDLIESIEMRLCMIKSCNKGVRKYVERW